MRLRWNGSQSAQREHLEALARVPKRRKKSKKRRAKGSQGSRNGLEPSGLDREYQRLVRGF